MGPVSLYCNEWRKNSKSCCDLDLDLAHYRTCTRYFHILFNVFQFHVARSITFLVIVQKHGILRQIIYIQSKNLGEQQNLELDLYIGTLNLTILLQNMKRASQMLGTDGSRSRSL